MVGESLVFLRVLIFLAGLGDILSIDSNLILLFRRLRLRVGLGRNCPGDFGFLAGEHRVGLLRMSVLAVHQ